MFCSFCLLTNRDIAKGKKDLCHKWCCQFGRDNSTGWICHHVDMVTDKHVDRCKREVSDLMASHDFFSDIEEIHKVYTIEEVRKWDDHLASNLLNWEPGKRWVIGTVRGYYGEGTG